MNGWIFPVICGLLVMVAGGVFELMKRLERLQQQVEHLHNVMLGQLQAIQPLPPAPDWDPNE
jgi:hypothetical protein